jgi:hypothetical protein
MERALAGTGHSAARYAATHAPREPYFGQPTKIVPRDYIFVNKTTGRSVESLVWPCANPKPRSRIIPGNRRIVARPGIAAWGQVALHSNAPRTGRGAIGWPAPFGVAAQTGHPAARYTATHTPREACFGQPTKIVPRDYIFVNKTTGRSVESLVWPCTNPKTWT